MRVLGKINNAFFYLSYLFLIENPFVTTQESNWRKRKLINVLLADDHQLVRTGLKCIINAARGLKVVAEAENGEQAVKLCREKQPNIVIMDMQMPGSGGLEATKKIKRQCPDTKVIILSMCSKAPFPSKALKLGAHGYLNKNTQPEDMIIAIRQVASGQRYIAPEIAQEMALNQIPGEDQNPLEALSVRELQVMDMVTRGTAVEKISDSLIVSPKTVNTYRYRLFDKLDVENDVEMTHLAIRHGVLDVNTL